MTVPTVGADPRSPARAVSFVRAARERALPGRMGRAALAGAALLPAAALAFIGYEMAKDAYPAIVFNGTHFFTGTKFSFGNLYAGTPVVHNGQRAAHGATYGALPFIFGTVVSSLLALVLAVPVAVGAAVLLVERIPRRYQGVLGVFLELLAGIPSVVFGLWGLFTFGPFLARDVYPAISALHIPWLSGHIEPNGQGLATSVLVLTVMIVPIIASTTRELIRSVPTLSKEGAVALGLTDAESVRVVTLPFVRSGVVAAAILGWGRALGETMAVLLISGDFLNAYPHSIFAPFSTMAGDIAAQLDGALTDSTGMAVHALAEVGLVLLVITVAANFAGRLITRRFGGGAALPVGRGV